MGQLPSLGNCCYGGICVAYTGRCLQCQWILEESLGLCFRLSFSAQYVTIVDPSYTLDVHCVHARSCTSVGCINAILIYILVYTLSSDNAILVYILVYILLTSRSHAIEPSHAIELEQFAGLLNCDMHSQLLFTAQHSAAPCIIAVSLFVLASTNTPC